jgi:hypothetical protein
VLAYAVTEWSETGKSNDLCSSGSLGSVRSALSRVDAIQDLRTEV